MCRDGITRQERVCKNAEFTAEQIREEGDIRTTGSGEPGADFLLSHPLRSTPA